MVHEQFMKYDHSQRVASTFMYAHAEGVTWGLIGTQTYPWPVADPIAGTEQGARGDLLGHLLRLQRWMDG